MLNGAYYFKDRDSSPEVHENNLPPRSNNDWNNQTSQYTVYM